MADVLMINGHDYSHYIQRKGVAWKRNDLDGNDSGRTLDGIMHRAFIATKRTCTYSLMDMPRGKLAELDTDLSAESFSATYLDLHGVQTREFYCSSFSASTDEVDEETGESYWTDASFTMIEI